MTKEINVEYVAILEGISPISATNIGACIFYWFKTEQAELATNV